MRFARFACLFVIIGSTALIAQSNTVALIDQPATGSVSSGLLKPDPKAQGKILESYGKLPLSFERNQGQANAQVKFLSRDRGYALFLTGDWILTTLLACANPGAFR